MGIYYFADYKLWKEEMEEKYTCSFKALKGLTKNQVNEEVQYLQCNRSGYFRSKQKTKEDQNQVVNSRPFYIINEYTQTLEFKYRNFARLPDKL